MPFAIETAQRRFFHENNWIEFEEAFSQKDIVRLQQFWAASSSSALAPPSYEKARDWRLRDTRIERLVSPFNELALELWNERPLYIAFDQVVSPNNPLWASLQKNSVSKSLASFFSVEFALGIIAVSLSPEPAPIIKKSQEETLWAGTSIGSVLAFKANDTMLFEKLDPKQTWWMVVYGTDAMRYNPQETDPLKEYFRVKGAAHLGKLTQAKIKLISR